ncbi:hypothetical protein ACWDLG_14975 [Nonomuraea sp. NPDC003727]
MRAFFASLLSGLALVTVLTAASTPSENEGQTRPATVLAGPCGPLWGTIC